MTTAIYNTPTTQATNSAPLEWPEPVQRVQHLAETGLGALPSQYIRPEPERPSLAVEPEPDLHIPLIDLSGLDTNDHRRKLVLAEIGHACEEWGFFQVINHGIPVPLLQRTLLVAKQFFDLPLEDKQALANDPVTYEGYGSRLGVEKGAILDWGDYFFFHLLPTCIRNPAKWPNKPMLWRETMEEYGASLGKLGHKILDAISRTLELKPDALDEEFGKDIGLALRINYYPPCPQPDLTLGLSAHSDPGGITLLLQDDNVPGLQVKHKGKWTTVRPVPGSIIVNLGDQIQIMSNGAYKSVEHRAVVNREKQRLSIAGFFNPCNEKVVGPVKELVEEGKAPLYQAMTFREYRSFIRRSGTRGKEIIESMIAPPSNPK